MRRSTALSSLALLTGLGAFSCTDVTVPRDGALPDSAHCGACDDGVFCNGVELCVGGVCVDGGAACAPGETCVEQTRTCTACAAPDSDGDGHASRPCGGDDCDDEDGSRFPNAAELCDTDAVDEDCDPATFGIRDADGDGHVDSECCNGEVCGDDCDDADGSAHPALPDLCGDRVDNDCDGVTDEGGMLYLDADNDGRGSPDVSMVRGCLPGWVANADDCDDENANTFGGEVAARERCDLLDNDCSLPADMAGGPDATEDADGDGHAARDADCLGVGETGANGTELPRDDCDDTDDATHPGMSEICSDAADNDCNPSTDSDCHCARDADCAALPVGGVCDEPSARCVECTPDTEAAICDGNSCDRLTFTCTGVPTGSRTACQSCRADSECTSGHRCIQHQYEGVSVGNYCAQQQTGGCRDQPFSLAVSSTSIDGVAGTFCVIQWALTTCEAVRAALEARPCPDGRDESCAPAGALCATVGSLTRRCTYPCDFSDECPASSPYNRCNGFRTTYCGGEL